MSSAKAIFHPRLRAFQIWGTRQGVGKTVASTVLCLAALQRRGPKASFYNVAFGKPIDKGTPFDNQRVTSVILHWRQGQALPKWFESRQLVKEYSFRHHDEVVLQSIRDYAELRADYTWSDRGQPPAGSWLFLETLTHVEARLPSRNCQADVYRELQLPGILVGDTQPGGVEATISAFESLHRREYDVQSVIVFKDPHENHVRINEHFEKLGIPCVALRAIPERRAEKDKSVMLDYYRSMARANVVKDVLKHFHARHAERVQDEEQRSKIESGYLVGSESELLEGLHFGDGPK